METERQLSKGRPYLFSNRERIWHRPDYPGYLQWTGSGRLAVVEGNDRLVSIIALKDMLKRLSL